MNSTKTRLATEQQGTIVTHVHSGRDLLNVANAAHTLHRDPTKADTMDDHFLDSDEFDRYHRQFQRDLEIHALNLKLYVSEEGHWLAKGRKILRWNAAFAGLACAFLIIQLCNWGEGPWWLFSITFSVISFVFAFRHHRLMKKAKAASDAFRGLEPPASLRALAAAIDEQIEEEDRVAAEARRARRWWRR